MMSCFIGNHRLDPPGAHHMPASQQRGVYIAHSPGKRAVLSLFMDN